MIKVCVRNHIDTTVAWEWPHRYSVAGCCRLQHSEQSATFIKFNYEIHILLQLLRLVLLWQCQFLNAGAFGPVPQTHGGCVVSFVSIWIDGDQVVAASGWSSRAHWSEHECFDFVLVVDQLDLGIRDQIIHNDHAAGRVGYNWLAGVERWDVLAANHIEQIKVILIGKFAFNLGLNGRFHSGVGNINWLLLVEVGRGGGTSGLVAVFGGWGLCCVVILTHLCLNSN